jgi:hypothetical protein
MFVIRRVEVEERLIAEIQKAFGSGCFDATSVKIKAREVSELLDAFIVAVPGSLDRRSGNGLRLSVVRRALTELAEEYFTTDQYGWMYIKEGSFHAKPPSSLSI